MESISDINLEVEDNPYLSYSLHELTKMFEKERIQYSLWEEEFGIEIVRDTKIKKAYKIKRNAARNKQKKLRKKQNKIQIKTMRAFNNNIISFHIIDNDSKNFKYLANKEIVKYILEYVRKFGSIKITISYTAKFIKNEKISTSSISIPGRNVRIINMSDIDRIPEIVEEIYNQNREIIDDMPLAESGSIFLKFCEVKINIARNAGMVGSAYIDLPQWIKDKKAVLNIQNKDEYCFLWSVLAANHHVDGKDHPERLSHYKKYLNELNIVGLEFPMKLSHIHKFEELNKISINVFGYNKINETESIYALYNSKYEFENEIDLLYVESEEVNENYLKNAHYALIRNFNKLARSSCISYKTSSLKSANIICKKCINYFHSESSYEKHYINCNAGHAQCVMPKIGENIVKFKNFTHKNKHPIAIYADFESILKPMNEKLNESETKIKHHETIMIGMYTKITNGDDEYNSFYGDDCLPSFFNKLKEVSVGFFTNKKNTFPKANLSNEEEEIFKKSIKCHLCNDEFSNETQKTKSGNDYQPLKKVIDHCHVTGKFLGAAHNKCNASWLMKEFVPIVMHNLSRYDSHLIIKSLKDLCGEKSNPKLIPKTEEEYITFSAYVPYGNKGRLIELRFIDSLRFMQASLDELSSNLLKPGKGKLEKPNKEKFKNLTKHIDNDSIYWVEEKWEESTQTIIDKDFNVKFNKVDKKTGKHRIKGIFPYEFVDSVEKMEYNNILTKNEFYDNLNQKSITDQEYKQYKSVWNSIQDVNMKKYMELYLMIDVLALADVFESFRDTTLSSHKLDPIYYYTAPGLSYDAMLYYTQVQLELLVDYDMLLMVEKGMRGGISGVTGDRYVDVEGKNFITNKLINHDCLYQEWLLYLDACNLYGYAMSQKLPTGGFKWLNEKQIKMIEHIIRNKKITGDENIGFMLDIDLSVPKTKQFENYPLAPESKIIKNEDLSDYSKSLNEKPIETSKLILDFQDKKNYIVHIKNLLFYYSKGCEFKINRMISFNQSAWLQSYIDLNTKLRTNSENDFEKDFFKLMNNSVFGKLMENIRQRVDIKIATNWENARKYIKKPTFDHLKIFNEDLIVIHMRRSRIVFNKPIYAGFAVLELSKLLMYSTYYERIQNMFNDVKLIYTDTDSLVLHIKNSGNIYKTMLENKDLFDLSDYPKDHILHSDENKKVVGKMKDELSGNVMNKFISLRSKMYSYKKYDGEFKRCKGIKRCVVKNELKFDDYYKCLVENKNTEHTFQRFKSINHDLYTISSTKKGLSAFDTKRYYLNNIESIPFQNK